VSSCESHEREDRTARGRLCLRRGQEFRTEPPTSPDRIQPQASQLATVAPSPAADARDDLAFLAHEDGQIDLLAEAYREDPRLNAKVGTT
jgi:hypothetical protein